MLRLARSILGGYVYRVLNRFNDRLPVTPMEQPTPSVTRADVERVVRRDFPTDQFDSVMSVLAEVCERRELHRVQLAILKLAAGRFDGLREGIECGDYRDVLAAAEYPGYSARVPFAFKLPADEQRKIFDEDWRQYETWLKS